MHGLADEIWFVLSSRLLPNRSFFAVRRHKRTCLLGLSHHAAYFIFFRTPDKLPPHFNRRYVDTVTLGLSGALYESATFSIHRAAVAVDNGSLAR